ncbi:MAG TPA: calcium-binding protein [Egibacteraceae bacterium]|nr:calcium-binding protein [Egibacteraceae bacterium]
MAWLLVVVLGSAAHADVPANDARAHATVIDQLPYSDALDVAEATVESNEPSCSWYGGHQRSVWYRFTATSDTRLVASDEGSSFTPLLGVFEGSASAMSVIACTSTYSERAVLAFDVSKGETYYINVASKPAEATSSLMFALRRQPTIESAVDDQAWKRLSNGRTAVTGTLRCSIPLAVQLQVQLSQKTPSGTVYARTTAYLDCAEQRAPWVINVSPHRGSFGKGSASVALTSWAPSESLHSTSTTSASVVECTQVGTVGDDEMVGTSDSDRLCGLYGADLIRARGGDHVVYGGPGPDQIYLGGGADIAYGGDGRDVIRGEGGDDRLYGGDHADLLIGGRGTDRCSGGEGRDRFKTCEARKQ